MAAYARLPHTATQSADATTLGPSSSTTLPPPTRIAVHQVADAHVGAPQPALCQTARRVPVPGDRPPPPRVLRTPPGCGYRIVGHRRHHATHTGLDMLRAGAWCGAARHRERLQRVRRRRGYARAARQGRSSVVQGQDQCGGGVCVGWRQMRHRSAADDVRRRCHRRGAGSQLPGFDRIAYLRCDAANDFFPDLERAPRTDVIFFCSPNNPTGAAATRQQLQQLVAFAQQHGSLIVYDAAYAPFIRDPEMPRSIYEIDGARSCAIEVNSFSKYAGFTGVRLGWTVVPSEVLFADGTPVMKDFGRVMNTAFNGASNIAQRGGLACLEEDGLREIDTLVEYYMKNASMIRDTMQSQGFEVHGGIHSPYVWVRVPGHRARQRLRPRRRGVHSVVAFAKENDCERAMQRISSAFRARVR
eukprot:ctg_1091.g346